MPNDQQYMRDPSLAHPDPQLPTWFVCEHPERPLDAGACWHIEYDGKICHGCFRAAEALEARGDKYGSLMRVMCGPRKPPHR